MIIAKLQHLDPTKQGKADPSDNSKAVAETLRKKRKRARNAASMSNTAPHSAMVSIGDDGD